MVFEHGLEAYGTHGQDGRATTKVFERRLEMGVAVGRGLEARDTVAF
jgi:hypothetical protein